jgi:TPR repeat protein
MELWLRAGELGCATAYSCISYAYDGGRGVNMDMAKAKYYGELAVMFGDVVARHNMGAIEYKAGNMSRAMKHYMMDMQQKMILRGLYVLTKKRKMR